jgi:hypothetical protein
MRASLLPAALALISGLVATSAVVGARAAGREIKPSGALPENAQARQQALLSEIPASARAWVTAESERLLHSTSIAGVRGDVKRQYPKLTASGVNDIAFLVLMAAEEALKRRGQSAAAPTKMGGPGSSPVQSNYSQFEEALSNMPKTIADMEQSDIQNLKS